MFLPGLLGKLLVSRELRFEGGKLLILSEPWFMLPIKIFIETTRDIINDPKFISKLYYTAKEGNRISMSKTLKHQYKLRGKKFIDLAMQMTQMGGWGDIKVITFDEITGHIIFNIYDSAIGSNFGPSKKPVDHIWRGILAGGVSVALNKDIDFVETACIAQGKPFCIYQGKPRNEWMNKPNTQVKEQLGIKKK